jgi:hypothetical protein
MYVLRKNQQQVIAFVLSDNAGNMVTGLGGAFNLSISKAGGAFVAGTGTKAEIGNGWYKYTIPLAETDTIGPFSILASGGASIQQNLIYVVESYVVGAVELTYTVTYGVIPIVGASVFIYTDVAGNNLAWKGVTDSFGVARDNDNELPSLYPGTYYIWSIKYGYEFDNPDTEVVA